MTSCEQAFLEFVEQVGRRQFLPQRKFLRDVISGILKRRSVLLSEIGRALEEPCRLIHTEKRLSRNLGSERFCDLAVEQDYLAAVEGFLRDPDYRCPTIAVDLTDVIKPRARAMPNLARVRDGSTGTIGNGYEIISIEAVGDEGRRMPLCSRLISHVHKDFKSENQLVAQAIRHVRPYVPDEALWVFDRAFDGKNHYRAFADAGIKFAVRMTVPKHDAKKGSKQKQRNIFVGGSKHRIGDLVHSLSPIHDFRIRKFREDAKRSWDVSVAWIETVQLQGYAKSGKALDHGDEEHPYSLVVARGVDDADAAKGLGQDPLVVLTNMPVTTAEEAEMVINAYMDRWGVEEAHRYLKQAFALEQIRALTWAGLRRLVLFAMLAYGYLSVLVHGNREQIEEIARNVKAFGPVPVYLFYRLLEGVPKLLGWAMPGGP